MPGSFLDTNVLLYIASGNTTKADRAEELIGAGGTISVQVLNEFASVAHRKLKRPWSEVTTALTAFRTLCPEVRALDLATHEAALAIAQRDVLSLYDALIVASALEAGCVRLLTEDMQDGRIIARRLTISNPFAAV